MQEINGLKGSIPIISAALGALIAGLLTAVITLGVVTRDNPDRYITVREFNAFQQHNAYALEGLEREIVNVNKQVMSLNDKLDAVLNRGKR